jgi:hypothetical protein
VPAQPTNPAQNTGLVIIVVGIFMVIITFLAVTYLNSDAIKTKQDKNSQSASTQRSDLLQITCALWDSVGEPEEVDPAVAAKVRAVCK